MLSEKKTKSELTRATVILGFCILISAFTISSAIRYSTNEGGTKSEDLYRYELISANEQNIIMFDKKTGDYWRKYIEPNEGPTEWEKQVSPVGN